MNRRRILLSYLANSFSWELYSKTYFYNELVPTTINSKNVLNKAKIVKVSGNGAIENQLVQNGNFESTTGWRSVVGQISISNNILTITLTQNLNANERKSVCVFGFFSVVNTNKYFISYQLKTSVAGSMTFDGNFSARATNSVSANIWNTFSSFSPATSNGNSNLYIQFQPSSNLVIGDTVQIKVVMVSNLTLREGTGNEPTTLTDNRIQNILNRGYIPFNLGKYKESDIGVVSSEPYNLFDGTLNVGGINNDGTDSNDSRFVRSDFISVLAGRGYSFETNFSATDTYWQRLIYEYDKNKNFIKLGTWASDGTISFSLPLTTTLSSNTAFIKIVIYHANDEMVSNPQICVHQSGTRTGYAPYKAPSTITFKYQGNGNETNHDSLEITKTELVFTKEVDYVDSVTMPTTRSTPQVITIPRKHLGIVKISDLSWNYDSGLKVFHNDGFAGKSQGGMYCSAFLTNTNLYASNLVDLTMTNRPYYTQHNICIKDLAIVSTADFLNKYGDYYIFYETENEVADIENVVDIESGGTITTDSEVLPNIELSVKCK